MKGFYGSCDIRVCNVLIFYLKVNSYKILAEVPGIVWGKKIKSIKLHLDRFYS